MMSSIIADNVKGWMEMASLVIELLAVVIIVAAIFYATARYLWQRSRRSLRSLDGDPYQQLKQHLGRSLMLGLEILVAATIVRTVALDDSLASVAVLGAMVMVRTFLGYALFVEVEGRWPWRSG
jgi:uncharacterized membrane protein